MTCDCSRPAIACRMRGNLVQYFCNSCSGFMVKEFPNDRDRWVPLVDMQAK